MNTSLNSSDKNANFQARVSFENTIAFLGFYETYEAAVAEVNDFLAEAWANGRQTFPNATITKW